MALCGQFSALWIVFVTCWNQPDRIAKSKEVNKLIMNHLKWFMKIREEDIICSRMINWFQALYSLVSISKIWVNLLKRGTLIKIRNRNQSLHSSLNKFGYTYVWGSYIWVALHLEGNYPITLHSGARNYIRNSGVIRWFCM